MSAPYQNLDFNQTFRYCGKTRYCKTSNPYDVDIAGIGVIISFIATAAFTLLTIVLGYLCEWLPGTDTNLVDRAVISTITTLVKFCFSPSLTRLKKLRHRLRARSLHKKHQPDDLRRKWSAALERFILALSDQQLVTGVAVLVTVYSKACEISIYSFQMAAALAWFSSTTHLATLTILTQYFDNHRVARDFRALIMVGMMFMLASAQIISNSQSVQHSATDAYFGCALKKSFKLTPIDGYEGINLCLIIAWLIMQYSSRMIALYSPNRASSRSWMTVQIARMFRLQLEEPTEKDDTLARLEQVIQAVDDRLCSGPLRRWSLLRRLCVGYTYFFALAGAIERAFTNSFLWHLIWLFFGATFGIGQVIFIRKDYTVPYRKDQEDSTLNQWGFGQILPLILLTLPILTGLEAYFETKDEIEHHPLKRSVTSSTVKKDDSGFEMRVLSSPTENSIQTLAPQHRRPTDLSITEPPSVYDLPLARCILAFYIVVWLGLSQLVAVSAATNFSNLGLLIPLVFVLVIFYVWSVVVFEVLELFNAFRRKRRSRKQEEEIR